MNASKQANRSIRLLWKEAIDKKWFTWTIDGDKKLRYWPQHYPSLSYRCLLYVGLNPSLTQQWSPEDKRTLKLTRSDIQDCLTKDETSRAKEMIKLENKYRGWEQHTGASASFSGLIDLTKSSGYPAGYWEHVDLFALREADDDNLKDALGITLINSGIENIRYESQHFVIKTLNEFADRQLSVSSELIDDLRPEVIVVVNATASHLLREKLKDRLKYNRRRRFHLLDVDGKSRGTPILFSGMITRGALDVYSRGRLLNDMERAREYVTRR